MIRKNSLRPGVDSLESKLLLTAQATSALAPAAVIETVTASSPGHSFGLSGEIQGQYGRASLISIVVGEQDPSNTIYNLSGSGLIAGLGDMTLKGHITATNLSAATGQLVLSNARGSLTLNIVGTGTVTNSSAFDPLPTEFNYQIASGTGAFRRDRGQGDLTFKSAPMPSSDTPVSDLNNFTIDLLSTPKPFIPPASSGLSGTAQGTFRETTRSSSVHSTTYAFNGSSVVDGLFPMAVRGRIKTPLNPLNASPSGRIVLSNARGSITLKITGAATDGPQYTFQIAHATGAFRHVSGLGEIGFGVTSPSNPSAVMPKIGQFTMNFYPPPLPG